MDNLIKNSIEYELNPFIIFNSEAKVVNYNQEAEFLLSYISAKEIFDLAMNYAPINYGYKNTYINLEYNRIKYYAIMVGYEDEEYIVVKLYKEVSVSEFEIDQKNISKVSIFTLLELAYNNTMDQNSINIIKKYDPSLPEMFLNVKEFLQLLNHSFKEFSLVKELVLSVYVKVAERIVLNGKRYPICCIRFYSSEKNTILDEIELLKFAKNANTVLYFEKNSIILEFALIE